MTDASLQIRIIQQALGAAQASLNLASQILADLSGQPLPVKKDQTPRALLETINPADLPGVVGTFDGENMVTAAGEKYPVPVNYASKTLLVFGDKLKMIEPPAGHHRAISGGKFFKQIDRVARDKVSGVLAQSGSDSFDSTQDKWQVVTAGGKHKVFEAAVKFHNLKVGESVWVLLPLDKKDAPFAALEGPVNKPLDQKPNLVVEKVVARIEVEKKAPVAVKPAKPAPVEVKTPRPVEPPVKRPEVKPPLAPEPKETTRRPPAITKAVAPAPAPARPVEEVKNTALPDENDLR